MPKVILSPPDQLYPWSQAFRLAGPVPFATVTKTANPDVVKDSYHDHHIAGTPYEYKHGWIKVGVGVDSKDLTLKKNGDVVHKPTGVKIGHVDKKTDFPTKGTSTFITSHESGKQVYTGVYKKEAMAALARTHNHEVAKPENQLEMATSQGLPKKPGPGTKSIVGGVPEGSTPAFSGGNVTHKPKSPKLVPEPKVSPGGGNKPSLTGSEAYAHAQTSQGQLSPPQLNALSQYGNPSGYKLVNPYLNKGGMKYNSDLGQHVPVTAAEDKKARSLINQLDSAFATSKPTTQRLVVHRRLGNSINDLIGPQGSSVGKTFENKAYVSTTTATNAKPGNGYGYEAKKTLMDIQLPRGSRVLLGQPAEKEVILPRGSKFTVIDDKMEPDGTRHVTVRLVKGSGQVGKGNLPAGPAEAPKPKIKPWTEPAVPSPSVTTDHQAKLNDLASSIQETHDESSFAPEKTKQSLTLANEALAHGDTAAAIHHLQNAHDHASDALNATDPEAEPVLHSNLYDLTNNVHDHLTEAKHLQADQKVEAQVAATTPKKSLSDIAKEVGDTKEGDYVPYVAYGHLNSAQHALNIEYTTTAINHLASANQALQDQIEMGHPQSEFLKDTQNKIHQHVEDIVAATAEDSTPTVNKPVTGQTTHPIGVPNHAVGTPFVDEHPHLAPLASSHVNAPTGNMVDSTDLSMKQDGSIVHKQTKQVIGTVVKQKDFPNKGTTTFTVTHNDGTQVYQGVYKGKSLAALAQHHNTQHVAPGTANVAAVTTPSSISPPTITHKKSLEQIQNEMGVTQSSASVQVAGKINQAINELDSHKDPQAAIPHLEVAAAAASSLQQLSTAADVQDHINDLKTYLEEQSPSNHGVFLPPSGALPIHDESGKPLGSWHPQTYDVTAPSGKHVGTTAIQSKAEAMLRANAKNDPASLSYTPVAGKPGSYESKLSGEMHGILPLYHGDKAGSAVAAAMSPMTFKVGEKSAFKRYSKSSYSAMNHWLLSGKQDYADPETKTDVERAEAALQRSTNTEPIAVMRSVPIPTVDKIFGPVGSKVGKSFKENKFISTTTSQYPKSSFGGVTLFYHLSPGTHALDMNTHNLSHYSHEKEVILGPGQIFKIVNDVMVNGHRNITLET